MNKKQTQGVFDEDRSPYDLQKRKRYLEKEIKTLSEADQIMSASGNEIKKAIKLLNDQLQHILTELQKG